LDETVHFGRTDQAGEHGAVDAVATEESMTRATRQIGRIAFLALAAAVPVQAAKDTTPPTVVITTPTTAATWTATGSPLALGGTAADNVAVKSVKWSNAATGGSGTATGLASWSASVPLAAGQNVISVTARDAAQNAGTDTITVTYNPPDTTPPTATITSPTTGTSYCTTGSPIALGGTASDSRGVTLVTWSNAASGASGTAAGTTSWTASIPLVPGGNLLTITAQDAAGNKGTDSITVAWNPADTTPPSAQIGSPTTDTAFSTTATPLDLGGTAADGAGVGSVVWKNAANGASGTASGTTAWTASVPLVAGENRITVTASDPTGNVGSDSITVDFQDSRGISHLPDQALPPLGWGQGAGLAPAVVSGRIYNELAANPADRMRDLAALGVRVIRMEIENTTPWSEYQTIVSAAQANGIEVLALVFLNSVPGSPNPMTGDITYFDNNYVPAYIAAVDATMANLPTVKFVEVWNEPDVYGFTPMYSNAGGTCVAQEGARRYSLLATRVFETMYQRRLGGAITPMLAAFGISRQDDNCLRKVLFDSTAVLNHRQYYRPANGLPDGLPADIVAVHGYGNGGKAPSDIGYTYQNGTFADGVNLFLGSKFADGRSVINQTPVWYTEVGYSVIQLGTETKQRDAVTTVFNVLRSHPEVTAAFWYVYRDDEFVGCSSGERFGLRDNRSTGFRPHLAYGAYQAASVAGGDVTPPSGALLGPAHGAEAAAGSPVAVTGWAIDAGGAAPVVEVAVDGVIAASVTDGNAPQAEACRVASSARCPNVGFSATVTAPTASGTHEIAAQARDAAGNVRVIGRVEIVVP
jgi:hypothetical protein